MTAGRPQQSPSAALLLGVLSGCFAAVAVLPTAWPLTARMVDAENTQAMRHVSRAVGVASRILEDDGSLRIGTTDRLGVDYLHHRDTEHLLLYREGPELPDALFAPICAATESVGIVADAQGRTWAIACNTRDGQQIVSGWVPRRESQRQVGYTVVTLSLMVGIVTALGVLRMLRPLSQLSSAIARVGAGERGVRATLTGMQELDEIVERLNAAARAMEDREDAIMARIKATQEMARIVAHEVRNPLQSLELLTSLIASEESSAERHELAKAIHAEIRALDMVVDRVLREGASRGALHLPLYRAMQPLVPLIDQVLALRGPEARAHGIVLERGPISPLPAPIDAALLGRSIENLVLNALQAVPPRTGRIRISVIADADSPYLRIEIEDNGPGVDPALQDHIFEPNVSGRTGGTGLGLALVKEVVEAHGGYIAQDRSPLGGARFSARIPRREDAVGSEPAQGVDR